MFVAVCGTPTLYALTAELTAVPRLDTFYSSSSIHVDSEETMHENGHARSEAKAARTRASIQRCSFTPSPYCPDGQTGINTHNVHCDV